ncbi:MAG: phosphate regulon transcriptional regulator PhoB [Proteobacteria bacterium]|nr:phosphate regulon transcriptional regulator PhoB [Pseudomonadota bacterium]
MLRYNLEKQGYRVAVAGDGEQALAMIAEEPPDLVVLDWMLPLVSGLEVCRRIRRGPATRDVGVLILTARGEEGDKVRGLDTGADDYLTKPFSLDELMARIRALLRRARAELGAEELAFADLRVDLARHRVTRGGRRVQLGPTEFRLLVFLMRSPGRVYSREELLNGVWGRDIHVEPRTVDVHIRRLRRELNAGNRPDLIRTVRAAGYALDTEAA